MPSMKLTDVLKGRNREGLETAWDAAEPAKDFAPLPAGEYVARIIDGAPHAARTGTPGYKLTFEVLEGEYAERRFWHDLWLTESALPMTKRDLGKLGITKLEQLEKPFPPGIRCKVKLALRRQDDGTEYNRVRSFEVLGIDEPEPNPYAPAAREGGER
jgi:hypothetical protein